MACQRNAVTGQSQEAKDTPFTTFSEEGMLMSWRFWAAAAVVAAGLVAAPSARAGDLFHLALPAGDAPAQTLVLKGDAETVAAGWRGYHRGYGYGYYRPRSYGYSYYRYPYRYPRYSFSFGYGYAPPVYYYPRPSYCYPMSVGVETYSLPGGNVSYSVTRPMANDAEPVPPPQPRERTFPYDGGPDKPVPMPKADPGPTKAPRYFFTPPLDELKVSLPAEKAAEEPAKGKFAYPAYGEEPRRIKDEKKSR